jgi:DNA-directed RNA polymerase specialized sigma24 family protein
VAEEGAGGEARGGFEPADDGPPPEAAVEFADFCEAFAKKISPRQQQALELQLAHKTRKEIACSLNVGLATVDRELKAIRERLQAELEHS